MSSSNPTEKELREFLARRGRRAGFGDRSNCLSEAAVVGFAEGRLSGDEREEAERHLAGCMDCLEDVAFVLRSRQSAERTSNRWVPPAAVSRSMWRKWPALAAAAGVILAVVLVTRFEMSRNPTGSEFEQSDQTTEAIRRESGVVGTLKIDFPRENMVLDRQGLEVTWSGSSGGVAEVWLTDASGRLVWSATSAGSRLRIPESVGLEPGRLYYVSVRMRESRDRVVRSEFVGFRVRTP